VPSGVAPHSGGLMEEAALTHAEMLTVLVIALFGVAMFGYWIRRSVRAEVRKRVKHKCQSQNGGPRRVGPGYSRKQRRH
jgi:hypothetical protein